MTDHQRPAAGLTRRAWKQGAARDGEIARVVCAAGDFAKHDLRAMPPISADWSPATVFGGVSDA